MRLPWLNRTHEDPIDRRARVLVGHVDTRVMAALPDLESRHPDLAGTDPTRWRRHATVAASRLAIFPLLRAISGDRKRFAQLQLLIRQDLATRFPGDDDLWVETDRATIPPTGEERAITLRDLDESQSLALARWVVLAISKDRAGSGSWEVVKSVATVLRQAVAGYWHERESGPS